MGRHEPRSQRREVATMDRQGLIKAILTVKCTFPVDLTEEFLQGLSIERLRHIYQALSLRARSRRSSHQPAKAR
ncbi:MAG: hypothetical protein B1H04_00920 [Planctomycetales bacterium 4484_123]|nr:MAG: hypothetical protein B1H04_00920 [Planctomycetales bacterium 4484_123]